MERIELNDSPRNNRLRSTNKLPDVARETTILKPLTNERDGGRGENEIEVNSLRTTTFAPTVEYC